MATQNDPLTVARIPRLTSEPEWLAAEHRFLAAVHPRQRPRVTTLLTQPRLGGRGLRTWVRFLATDRRPLPAVLPAELIEVYLTDPQAEPLHDCSRCGLAVPVRVGWHRGHDSDPEHVYFGACPACGGSTGLYAFWASSAGSRAMVRHSGRPN